MVKGSLYHDLFLQKRPVHLIEQDVEALDDLMLISQDYEGFLWIEPRGVELIASLGRVSPNGVPNSL